MKPLHRLLTYTLLPLLWQPVQIQAGIFSRQQIDDDAKKDKPMATVRIQGADKALAENIKLMLPSRKPLCNANKSDIENFQKSAQRYLVKAAKGLGYYHSQFSIYPQYVQQCWVFAINVQAGRVTRVDKVDVQVSGEGNKDKAFQEIVSKTLYQRGDALQQQKYTDYKSSLTKAARSLGYFDAEFTQHKIAVNPDTYSADIMLHLNTGKRYRYGNIKLQQDILDPNYVQRFVQIKEGAFYNSDDLSKQQLYLQSTGYYSDVLIHTANSKAQNNRVPVDIELTPRKRNTYEFIIGYDTDMGAHAGVSFDRHWTGRKGRKLSHKFGVSKEFYALESRYTVPLHHPKTENISYNVKLEQYKTNDIKMKTAEIGATYTRKNAGGYQQTASLEYSTGSLQIGEDKLSLQYLLAGARIDKTKRNDPVHPNKGYHLSLDVKVAHKSLASTQNIAKVELNAKYLNPVGKGRLVSQLKLGTVQSEDFDLLPEELRFFAGGRNSVRGYDFKSLGERTEDGENIGGKYLISASLEYDHPVAEKWEAATFIDVGNAFHNIDEPLKVGAGVGVRWKSPVGPVSVDIAWPKDNLSDPHLHLSIGPEL
jgi:translocation and assembly module TamA